MPFLYSLEKTFIYLLVLANVINAFHDSLNFVLQPKARQCFYENFDSSSPTRTLEAFVQSGGNADVLLTIHGPLTLDDIRAVSINYHIPSITL